MDTTSTITPRSEAPSRFTSLFIADRAVLFMIGLNTLVLALLAFDAIASHPALTLLDYTCTTYFVLEALVKIRTLGARAYFDSPWNRFDFAIVLASLPSYALTVWDLPDLSFLLLLRVARVVKFFRFMRVVPNMPQMIDGVVRAIRASAFVLIAFFLFNFVIALVSCHLFRSAAPEYFGNPLVSFYSIFKVFTVEGWYEIPDAIADASSMGFAFFTRAYFMVIVVTGGIFGLSMVNAIFVDEMLRNENDLVEKRLEELDAKLDRLLAARGIESAEISDRDIDRNGDE